MPAADPATLQVRSSRVLLDGAFTAAVVELQLEPGGRARFVRTLGAGDEGVEDVGTAYIVPAPLDLHLHGCGGAAVPPGGSSAHIASSLASAASARAWGARTEVVPGYEWLATLPVPACDPADPVEHVAAAAAELASPAGAAGHAVAPCVGVRIEGLFLNPARAGIWPAGSFRALDVGLLEELATACRAGGAPLRIVDIAPELAPADLVDRFIARARELDVVVALAHTDATWEQACAAIDAGATLATHLWNAMRPLGHRDPGVIGACMADPRVACELICDGAHLHTGTIAVTTRAVGPGRWAVISDASPFAGCDPGRYDWAGTTVVHDGASLRDDAGRLAGSASLAWDAAPQLRAAGVSDADVAIAMGATPRRVLDPARPLGLVTGDPVWIGGPEIDAG